MPVDLWFPLAVYYEDLADAAAHHEAYVRHVYDALDRSASDATSAAWTGDVHGADRLHDDDRFAWLTEAVATHAWKYLTLLGHDVDELDIHIQRSWPVVAAPGQGVAGHSHHNAHVSAVYFVAAASGAGTLRFANASRPNEVSPGAGSGATGSYREHNPLNYGAAEYEAIAGRLLLFPAKQRHEVLLNESSNDRLSISFDLVLSTRCDRAGGVHEFLMPPPERWRRVPRPEPAGAIRADRPMELAALCRRAGDADELSLPRPDSHLLWRTFSFPHCSSRARWLRMQRDERTDPDSPLEQGRHWAPVAPHTEAWSAFRDAVDRVHLHLGHRDVATRGVTVTPPTLSTAKPSGDAPFARTPTDLDVYLRLDHGDGACVIEFAEGSEAVAVEPGSLALISGFRLHRVLGEGVLLRFGIDVPSLARPRHPGQPTAPHDSVDDRTAFHMATAIPLTAPAPSSARIVRELGAIEARRSREHRHATCPVVRKYLVDAADPNAVTDDELAVIRRYGRTTDAIADHGTDVVRRARVLDRRECRALIAYGRNHMTSIVADSVDGLPEYQVDLGVEALAAIIGDAAVARLLALPAEHGTRVATSRPAVSLFLRMFSPDTRPYITFHSDVAAWTVNVPLDDDDDDIGGRLLMLVGGALHAERRAEGVGLSHPSELIHGVSRVKAGERWSLIALFHAADPTTEPNALPRATHETEPQCR